MKLCADDLKNRALWEEKGYRLPAFDREKLREATRRAPAWLHLGAGNIFRAFPAAALQTLLEKGLWDRGLIVAECFDGEIIDRTYTPFDGLSLLCVLKADGSVEKRVIASVTEALRCDGCRPRDEEKLLEVLSAPSLQLVTLTITEKGYAVKAPDGTPLPLISRDLALGPGQARSTLGKLAAGLYSRWRAGRYPLALCSLDNCSHNGDKLKEALSFIAGEWAKNGLAEAAFADDLLLERRFTFPISMIDKITPRPDAQVSSLLEKDGFADTGLIVTDKNTYTAAFVNAEETEYLVWEDRFPAGRPPLEAAGIYFTDRATVDQAEKMKVCTCLNPLHTALALLGCLLSYHRISDEMRDEDLKGLVYLLAYAEAMPASADPGILSPRQFAREVLEKRLLNPFMPDTPQRIASDTSQKLPIRFGETLKTYLEREELDIGSLRVIPFVLAAWLRYLMCVDDVGRPFEPSPDPLLAQMRERTAFLRLGGQVTEEQLQDIFARKDLFAVDLNAVGLAGRVAGYLNEMLEGTGAVRRALQRLLWENRERMPEWTP